MSKNRSKLVGMIVVAKKPERLAINIQNMNEHHINDAHNLIESNSEAAAAQNSPNR